MSCLSVNIEYAYMKIISKDIFFLWPYSWSLQQLLVKQKNILKDRTSKPRYRQTSCESTDWFVSINIFFRNNQLDWVEKSGKAGGSALPSAAPPTREGVQMGETKTGRSNGNHCCGRSTSEPLQTGVRFWNLRLHLWVQHPWSAVSSGSADDHLWTLRYEI